MKTTMNKLLIFLSILFTFNSYSQNTITLDDLKSILGTWTGTLTYIDYSSNKPFTMPADLIVKKGKNENKLLLFYSYPKEPNANSTDKIKISKNGSQLNNKDVKSKQMMPNGDIQITTEHSGKDNNMKALIKNIYILGTNQITIRKEVKFENSESWLLRNEYSFLR